MDPQTMSGQTLHPQVLTAIIAGVVSAIGAVLALLGARWQLRGKMLELDLKKAELEKTGARLEAEAEALRQTIMRDVLVERMAAYAALWQVFITYERNWLYEHKIFDEKWASDFLHAVNSCNADHGVFFSQAVYRPFFEYRRRLLELVAKVKDGNPISNADINNLMEISTIGTTELKSMAGAMKDELGSYMRVAIQTT
ncbi:hypothetical protein D1AOALGA4SA_11911 [Olavius algarvensis Delta 1 endosymbiont]|nr:hypothetical protein D1AOALGA4SA_11911 [Olavius algarvensis Delta 1 endosymbiont]